MWVGRGDFAHQDWDEALALAEERAETLSSPHPLSHPMAADYIAGGLKKLGHGHILQDGWTDPRP